jgi:hypothetical protein
LGEVAGVGVGDDAEGLIPEGELGVPEQGLVGGGDQPPGDLQDGIRGSGPDAGGEFLGLLLELGTQRLGHDDLLPGKSDRSV